MKQPIKRVSVIGLGYIGLPTAAILANRGLHVIAVDVNEEVVRIIAAGKTHIAEPDIGIAVHRAVDTGMLRPVTKPEPAEIFLIAVPTPILDDYTADLSYIKAAAGSIAPVLEKGNLVILESTSPVGTTEKLCQWLADLRKDLTFPHKNGEDADVMLAYCPERVLPGKIIPELIANARTIGGMSQRSTERAIELYSSFVDGECLATNVRTAEMVKLAENAYRDVNIAFANELSLIADHLDIDVWDLIELANHHPRVNILQPGPGVGGHCIAIDPWFIVESVPEQSQLIRTARQVNDSKPHYVVEKIRSATSGMIGPVIACLGLAYKPDVGDLRGSPAMQIVKQLAAESIGRVLAVEPNIDEIPQLLADAGVSLTSLDYAIKKADVIVLLVNHESFYDIDPEALYGKKLVDTRGIWK